MLGLSDGKRISAIS